MEDQRWTVRDKLEQFRGLAELYNSTNANVKEKMSDEHKKQNKEIKNLTTQNKKFRKQYEEVLHGDKKNLLPVLNEHPTTQLAMKNLNTQQIEEELKQSIFNKNKELDRLRFKRKNLKEILLNEKLESAELENTIEDAPQNYIWEQEIENQLQSVNVKLNTARANRGVYEKALDVLQKDAIRFDEVLEGLRKDLTQQCDSIVRAVEMGQNISEELSRLRKEYRATERTVRSNMRQRDSAIRELRADIDNIRMHGQSAQRDSRIGLPTQAGSGLESDSEVNIQALMEDNLKQEINVVEAILDQIKVAAKVNQVQDICPRIEEQKKQKAWLQKQIEQNSSQLARMLELHNQLDVMLEVTMYHTLTDEAKQLKEDRVRLRTEVEKEKQNLRDTQAKLVSVGEKIVDVRTALLTLNMMLDTVMSGSEDSGTDLGISLGSDTGVGTGGSTLGNFSQPNTDALTLMEQVTRKVKWLTDRVGNTEPTKPKLSTKYAMDISQLDVVEDEADNIVSDMLDELEDMDDPSVLSRKAIKAESQRLVDLHNNPRALFQDTKEAKFKKHKCF